MAPRNQWDLALLNDVNKPLYRTDDGKYDAVSHAFNRLKEKSGSTLTLKQFRKIGASAMERLGGQQPRRLYKAGTIDSGDKVYVVEARQNLTPVLDKWGDELRADGILESGGK
jgi:hypothetical protein